MAQIDLKECTIKLFDGTLGTATLDSVPADSDLTLTAISKHIGSDKISCELIDPATATGVLAVSVVGRKITVTLGTSTASALDSTAAEVKTAIEANATANALVTVALETAGTGVCVAIAETSLDGQQSLTVKVGEGNLTHSEHRAVEFTRDRGVLDSVRLADEEPVDISMDIMWEWISSVGSSGTPTMEDALKNINEASAWLTTADDTCQPFCLDIEFHNAPQCTAIEDEILMFEEYYYESLDHDPREGTISTAGRCNRTVATATRILAADIG